MLHTKQEKVEKDIIALKKRRDYLSDLKYRYRVVKPVEEPYQDGWIVYPALRDDAMNRTDADRMLAALNSCSNSHTTKNPKLVSQIRKLKSLDACRGLFLNKGYNYFTYYTGPQITFISEKKYNELPEEIKVYFYPEEEISRWGNVSVKKFYFNYGKVPHYYIILKVKPRMITHCFEPDPDVESELEWVNTKLSQLQAWRSSWYNKWERRLNNRRERLAVGVGKRKFLKGELEDIPNAKRDLVSRYD